MSPPRTLFVSVGQRFDRGVVVDPEIQFYRRSGVRVRGVRLLCDCGNSYEAPLAALLRGQNPSCGCLSRNHRTWHGLHDHPLYATWWNMIRRCENPVARGYARYGGCGIKVCDDWHDLAVFVADIERILGPRPEGMTLDRREVRGNYEPGNVRWATWSVQRQNQVRGSLSEGQVREIRARYEAGGVKQAELAEEFGVSSANISLIITRKNWKGVALWQAGSPDGPLWHSSFTSPP